MKQRARSRKRSTSERGITHHTSCYASATSYLDDQVRKQKLLSSVVKVYKDGKLIRTEE